MKFLGIISSIVFLVVGMLFVFFTGVVFFQEIITNLRAGTITVEASSMILNHVWVGNRIYVLVTIYLAVAAGLITGGITLLRRTLRRH